MLRCLLASYVPSSRTLHPLALISSPLIRLFVLCSNVRHGLQDLQCCPSLPCSIIVLLSLHYTISAPALYSTARHSMARARNCIYILGSYKCNTATKCPVFAVIPGACPRHLRNIVRSVVTGARGGSLAQHHSVLSSVVGREEHGLVALRKAHEVLCVGGEV